MQSVSFRITGKVWRRRRQCRVVLVMMLILAGLGCTGHNNPFDPKNEQTNKGKPFNLQAEPQFGRIDLRWDRLPPELEIDRYQIDRRTASPGWDSIAALPGPPFQDKSVANATDYFYRISAWRRREKSDFSEEVIKRAYWYPKVPELIGDYDNFPNPLDIAFCLPCNRRYVVCEGRNFIAVLDEFDKKVGDNIPVGDIPLSVGLWHDEISKSDTLLVCNYGDMSLSVIAKKASGQYDTYKTISLDGLPLWVQVSKSLRQAYVSIEESASKGSIARINLNGLKSIGKLPVNAKLIRMLLVNDSGHLLGVNQDENKIIIIDNLASSPRIREVGVELGPFDLAIVPRQNLAYVACKTKISVVDFVTGERVREREITLPTQDEPKSVAVVPEGPNDGLLFIAVSSIMPESRTLIYGYHIGPQIQESLSMQLISPDIPRLIRRLPDSETKKLYVLHSRGLHTYY